MDEVERNTRLMKLIIKLNAEKDIEAIELLKTMVDKDTPGMQKSFEIMTKNTPLSDLFGVKNLADAFIKKNKND